MRWLRTLASGLIAAVVLVLAPAAPAEREAPVVSLIIDDLAYNADLGRRTLALPRPFTIAVLPDSPYARAVQAHASVHGIGVMLHLPMDAGAPPRNGDNVIAATMTETEMRHSLRAALARVPRAIAVNNHEGSVLTADAEAMAIVMDELRDHGGLMFVDSRTNADTVAARAAREAGLASTSRDVFLDHDPAAEAVDRAVDSWLAAAERRGCALAIAHPREATLEVLERRLPRMAADFDIVDLPTYIDRCED